MKITLNTFSKIARHIASRTIPIVGCVLALAGGLRADLIDTNAYYVGVDSRANLTTGTYNGLADPNYNRLTFLLAHGDHYHAKGVYSYSGPAGSPTVNPTSTGNYLPEGNAPRIELRPGQGVYAGTMRSGIEPIPEQGHFVIRGVDHLAGFAANSLEQTLLNSSAGRWNTLLGNSNIYLNLHSKSDDLMIGDSLGNRLFNGTSQMLLGTGNSFLFEPVFYLNETVANGDYFARFTLSTDNPSFGDSGQFEFRFAQVSAVPEPTSLVLLTAAGSAVLVKRFRRTKKLATNA